MALIHSEPSISPSRLLVAADRLLKGIRSTAGLNACVSMYLVPIGSESSRSPRVFTLVELLDAMDPAPPTRSRSRSRQAIPPTIEVNVADA